ncbi:unnamed protein product [Amoebophrya sp. A120]|nr:unnamed protein product [Amoebophrya sp. A120]|eukprot:GSA120T00004392001.1
MSGGTSTSPRKAKAASFPPRGSSLVVCYAFISSTTLQLSSSFFGGPCQFSSSLLGATALTLRPGEQRRQKQNHARQKNGNGAHAQQYQQGKSSSSSWTWGGPGRPSDVPWPPPGMTWKEFRERGQEMEKLMAERATTQAKNEQDDGSTPEMRRERGGRSEGARTTERSHHVDGPLQQAPVEEFRDTVTDSSRIQAAALLQQQRLEDVSESKRAGQHSGKNKKWTPSQDEQKASEDVSPRHVVVDERMKQGSLLASISSSHEEQHSNCGLFSHASCGSTETSGPLWGDVAAGAAGAGFEEEEVASKKSSSSAGAPSQGRESTGEQRARWCDLMDVDGAGGATAAAHQVDVNEIRRLHEKIQEELEADKCKEPRRQNDSASPWSSWTGLGTSSTQAYNKDEDHSRGRWTTTGISAGSHVRGGASGHGKDKTRRTRNQRAWYEDEAMAWEVEDGARAEEHQQRSARAANEKKGSRKLLLQLRAPEVSSRQEEVVAPQLDLELVGRRLNLLERQKIVKKLDKIFQCVAAASLSAPQQQFYPAGNTGMVMDKGYWQQLGDVLLQDPKGDTFNGREAVALPAIQPIVVQQVQPWARAILGDFNALRQLVIQYLPNKDEPDLPLLWRTGVPGRHSRGFGSDKEREQVAFGYQAIARYFPLIENIEELEREAAEAAYTDHEAVTERILQGGSLPRLLDHVTMHVEHFATNAFESGGYIVLALLQPLDAENLAETPASEGARMMEQAIWEKRQTLLLSLFESEERFVTLITDEVGVRTLTAAFALPDAALRDDVRKARDKIVARFFHPETYKSLEKFLDRENERAKGLPEQVPKNNDLLRSQVLQRFVNAFPFVWLAQHQYARYLYTWKWLGKVANMPQQRLIAEFYRQLLVLLSARADEEEMEKQRSQHVGAASGEDAAASGQEVAASITNTSSSRSPHGPAFSRPRTKSSSSLSTASDGVKTARLPGPARRKNWTGDEDFTAVSPKLEEAGAIFLRENHEFLNLRALFTMGFSLHLVPPYSAAWTTWTHDGQIEIPWRRDEFRKEQMSYVPFDCREDDEGHVLYDPASSHDTHFFSRPGSASGRKMSHQMMLDHRARYTNSGRQVSSLSNKPQGNVLERMVGLLRTLIERDTNLTKFFLRHEPDEPLSLDERSLAHISAAAGGTEPNNGAHEGGANGSSGGDASARPPAPLSVLHLNRFVLKLDRLLKLRYSEEGWFLIKEKNAEDNSLEEARLGETGTSLKAFRQKKHVGYGLKFEEDFSKLLDSIAYMRQRNQLILQGTTSPTAASAAGREADPNLNIAAKSFLQSNFLQKNDLSSSRDRREKATKGIEAYLRGVARWQSHPLPEEVARGLLANVCGLCDVPQQMQINNSNAALEYLQCKEQDAACQQQMMHQFGSCNEGYCAAFLNQSHQPQPAQGGAPSDQTADELRPPWNPNLAAELHAAFWENFAALEETKRQLCDLLQTTQAQQQQQHGNAIAGSESDIFPATNEATVGVESFAGSSMSATRQKLSASAPIFVPHQSVPSAQTPTAAGIINMAPETTTGVSRMQQYDHPQQQHEHSLPSCGVFTEQEAAVQNEAMQSYLAASKSDLSQTWARSCSFGQQALHPDAIPISVEGPLQHVYGKTQPFTFTPTPWPQADGQQQQQLLTMLQCAAACSGNHERFSTSSHAVEDHSSVTPLFVPGGGASNLPLSASSLSLSASEEGAGTTGFAAAVDLHAHQYPARQENKLKQLHVLHDRVRRSNGDVALPNSDEVLDGERSPVTTARSELSSEDGSSSPERALDVEMLNMRQSQDDHVNVHLPGAGEQDGEGDHEDQDVVMGTFDTSRVPRTTREQLGDNQDDRDLLYGGGSPSDVGPEHPGGHVEQDRWWGPTPSPQEISGSNYDPALGVRLASLSLADFQHEHQRWAPASTTTWEMQKIQNKRKPPQGQPPPQDHGDADEGAAAESLSASSFMSSQPAARVSPPPPSAPPVLEALPFSPPVSSDVGLHDDLPNPPAAPAVEPIIEKKNQQADGDATGLSSDRSQLDDMMEIH